VPAPPAFGSAAPFRSAVAGNAAAPARGCGAGLGLRCCDPSILFSRSPPLLLATAASHRNPPRGRVGLSSQPGVLLGEPLRKHLWGLLGARGLGDGAGCWASREVWNGLGSSGCCWPWGRLSGPRGVSQQGVLGEGAGFPKGTRPNSTAVAPVSAQV